GPIRTRRAGEVRRRFTPPRSPAILRAPSCSSPTAPIRTRRIRNASRRSTSRAIDTAPPWRHSCIAPSPTGSEPDWRDVSEDRLTKRARDELHGERRGAIAFVEDRVYLG